MVPVSQLFWQKYTLRNKTKQFLFNNNNVLSIDTIVLLNKAFNERDMDEWPLSKDAPLCHGRDDCDDTNSLSVPLQEKEDDRQ